MISVIMLARIVSPGIREMTLRAIRDFRENTTGPAPELILVRNGGDRLGISRSDIGLPGVTLDFQEGVSLASAYNRGAEKAHGEHICIMDNDVELPPDWNTPMELASSAGAIAFPMVNEEESDCEDRGVVRTAPMQTTGACFMMTRRTWDALGGYDEGYEGFHWEDLDLFRRAFVARVPAVRCTTTIVHHRGATRSMVPDEEGYDFHRNREYQMKKFGDLRMVLIPCSPS